MASMAELNKMAEDMNRRADVLADEINKVLAGCNVHHCIIALAKMNCQIVGEQFGKEAAHELMELLCEANAEIFARYNPAFAGAAQAQHDPEVSALVSLVKVMPRTKRKAAGAGK